MIEEQENRLSLAAAHLMRGIVYREEKPDLWEAVLKTEAPLRDYMKVLGLELRIVDEDGYAYLAVRETGEGESSLPRLISRRALSYPVSLILVLLRRKITEADVNSGESRLIMDREEVADMVSAFFPSGANEVKLLKRLDGYLQKIHDLGFIRYLGEKRDKIEVKKILKSFVDTQWLSDFDEKLEAYRTHGGGSSDGGDEA